MHVHDLFRLHSCVVRNFEHLLTPAAHALVPLEETSDWEVRRHANLDLFVAEGQRGHPVIVESAPPAPHDLHVLLRHGPRSISPKGAAEGTPWALLGTGGPFR